MIDRAMVDTNVLIFAFRKAKPKDGPDLRMWTDASRELLKQMTVVRVSAVAWMEFVRGLRDEESANGSALLAKIRPEAVDGPIVERAVALLRARKLKERLCTRCNNAMSAAPCPGCKRLVSSKQNLNDAIIVAAAELTEDVDTLYCYDTGVHDFVPYLDSSRCKLLKPSHPIGPLFEQRPK